MGRVGEAGGRKDGAGADSLSNWFSCIPEFAKGFHVIAVDLLGFGGTGKPDPAKFTYSQDARNDHMTAFIEALKLGPVNMIGNSMGGATTIGVCVKRPDLVKKAVLMGSAGLSGEMSPALLAAATEALSKFKPIQPDPAANDVPTPPGGWDAKTGSPSLGQSAPPADTAHPQAPL